MSKKKKRSTLSIIHVRKASESDRQGEETIDDQMDPETVLPVQDGDAISLLAKYSQMEGVLAKYELEEPLRKWREENPSPDLTDEESTAFTCLTYAPKRRNSS